jgi:hypothetical protein
MLYSEIFDRSMEEKKPLSLLKSDDSDDFWFGIVVDYNEDVVELQLFDGYGEFDGYMVTETDYVMGVEYDDEYEMTTAYLMAENDFTAYAPASEVKLKASKNMYHALVSLMDKNIPVAIGIDEEPRMGYLEKVSPEGFELRAFDHLGDARGRYLCTVESVEFIQYFSKKVKKSSLLYEWRQKNGKK